MESDKKTSSDYYLIELERYKMALEQACKDLPTVLQNKCSVDAAMQYYLECADYSPILLDLLEEKLNEAG